MDHMPRASPIHNGGAEGVYKTMTEPTEDALRAALRAIFDPRTGSDIVRSGRVESLHCRNGEVQVALLASRNEAAAMEPVRRAVERLLGQQPGVRHAHAVLTAHRSGAAPGQAPAQPAASREAPSAKPKLLADTRFVVAVASGKGGVGKSTTATNLAVALARNGRRVGLLDADVHGPSVPTMLGARDRPGVREGTMVPLEAWGVRALSLGMMVDADAAMIWRGPMVMGALEQLMGQADWGALDVMVVDMPPGTGDAQLTMAQRVNLAGAVIVSTPQDLALADARRGVRMFERTGVPILGLVENMSVFCCPNCGHRAELFGHGGARREAEALGVPFLGEVPLLMEVRESADSGQPIVAALPDSPAAAAYRSIADAVWARLTQPGSAAPSVFNQEGIQQ